MEGISLLFFLDSVSLLRVCLLFGGNGMHKIEAKWKNQPLTDIHQCICLSSKIDMNKYKISCSLFKAPALSSFQFSILTFRISFLLLFLFQWKILRKNIEYFKIWWFSAWISTPFLIIIKIIIGRKCIFYHPSILLLSFLIHCVYTWYIHYIQIFCNFLYVCKLNNEETEVKSENDSEISRVNTDWLRVKRIKSVEINIC